MTTEQENLWDWICVHVDNKEIEQAIKRFIKTIKTDLIKIADQGEYEDLRREVENYFKEK